MGSYNISAGFTWNPNRLSYSMDEPILVRSSLRAWDFTFLLVIGVGFLIGAALTAVTGTWVGAVLLAVPGSACLVGSLWGQRRRERLRRWVRDLGDGFLVI